MKIFNTICQSAGLWWCRWKSGSPGVNHRHCYHCLQHEGNFGSVCVCVNTQSRSEISGGDTDPESSWNAVVLSCYVCLFCLSLLSTVLTLFWTLPSLPALLRFGPWIVWCFLCSLSFCALVFFFFKEPFHFSTPVCSAVGSHLHHIMTADLRSMQQYRPQYNTKRPILQDLMNEYDDWLQISL